MSKVKLTKKIKKIHFVGIGGASMSALAKLMHSKGYIVSGVDDIESTVVNQLRDLGITVYISSSEVLDTDLVVYTVAAQNNIDIERARQKQLPIIERAQFLGELSKRFTHSIAIAGTHGKSTTTALLGHIFCLAGKNPTVHLGGESSDLGGNIHIGGEQYFISEACEYNRSFLALSPECCCINNIECDHMDTYKNWGEVSEAFCQFARQTKKVIIYNGDSVTLPRLDKKTMMSFGFDKKNTVYARLIRQEEGKFTFDCYYKSKFLFRAKSNLEGKHNVANALGCVCIALYYKIPLQYIIKGIQTFLGVDRRMIALGEVNGVRHIADYAHHPTEIKAALDTLKLLDAKRVIVVFQPHTYSRTLHLLPQFVSVLSNCSDLVLLPTYAARESPISGGDATDLFFALPRKNNILYATNFYNLKSHLDNTLTKGDICVWLGAGDIINIAKTYVNGNTNK